MVLLMAVLCSASCTMFGATEPVPRDTAKAVPPERILAYTDKKDGYVSVFVTRDAGIMGSGCYIGLVVDGTLAGRFGTTETAEFFLPVGESDMAVVRDPHGRGLCAIGSWNPVPEHYVIRADAPNLFRISLGAWRRPRLLPTVY